MKIAVEDVGLAEDILVSAKFLWVQIREASMSHDAEKIDKQKNFSQNMMFGKHRFIHSF